MDLAHCASLVEHRKALPDPRDPRGVRRPWWAIPTIAAAARLAGHTSDRQTAAWAWQHRRLLAAHRPLYRGRPPSQSTFQRAFSALDVAPFEDLIGRFVVALTPASDQPRWGLALDGKTVRLAVAEHGSGNVLRQGKVSDRTPAARELLAELDLTGVVVTADAMHCQRKTAALILAQGGRCLLRVKPNQQGLHRDLAFLFEDPRTGANRLTFQSSAYTGGGHGRVEDRLLEASSELNQRLAGDWPGLGQVIRRTCRRWRGQHQSEEHRFYITSLTADEATTQQLDSYCRGHWTIENCVFYCRDVTCDEDAANQRGGSAPQARAALTNAVKALFRSCGARYLTDAIAAYQANPVKALRDLGCRRL